MRLRGIELVSRGATRGEANRSRLAFSKVQAGWSKFLVGSGVRKSRVASFLHCGSLGFGWAPINPWALRGVRK